MEFLFMHHKSCNVCSDFEHSDDWALLSNDIDLQKSGIRLEVITFSDKSINRVDKNLIPKNQDYPHFWLKGRGKLIDMGNYFDPRTKRLTRNYKSMKQHILRALERIQ